MTNTQLRNEIDSYIKANGNREITGPILNTILNYIVDTYSGYDVTVFLQSNTPTPNITGDIWFKTDTFQVFRWNGASWEAPNLSGNITSGVISVDQVNLEDINVRIYRDTGGNLIFEDLVAGSLALSDINTSSLAFDTGLTKTGTTVNLGGDIDATTVDFYLYSGGEFNISDAYADNIVAITEEGFTVDNTDVITSDRSIIKSIQNETEFSLMSGSTASKYIQKAFISGGTEVENQFYVEKSGKFEINLRTDTGAEITDTITGEGFKYKDDYSSTFVERSLVDKAYVDSLLGGFNANGSWFIAGANYASDPINSLAAGNASHNSSATGVANVAIGAFTLNSLTSGPNNTAVGYSTGSSLTSGIANNLLGSNAGTNLTSGSYNVLIGRNAGNTLTSTNRNICIGDLAGYWTTGSDELYISSISDSAQGSESVAKLKALVYGVNNATTASQFLRVNGSLEVNSLLKVDSQGYTGSGTGITFGDEDTLIYESADDVLEFQTFGSTHLKIWQNGEVNVIGGTTGGVGEAFEIYDSISTLLLTVTDEGYMDAPGVYAETTASAANVYVHTDGSLQRSTSSIKIKKDIDYNIDPNLALQFKPASFVSKINNEKYYGFIAEDMQNIDKRLATEGDLPGLEMNAIVASLSATLNEKNKEIKELKEKISKIENKIYKV
jgi:hypothetical protein